MSATRKKVYGTATISDGGDDNCGNIYDDGVDVGDGCVCICVSIISLPFVFVVVVVLYGMKREKLDKSEKSKSIHTHYTHDEMRKKMMMSVLAFVAPLLRARTALAAEVRIASVEGHQI